MSGAWRRSFTLSAPVSISFVYRLTQTEDYESDEFSEALMAIDSGSNLTIIATLTGNGNGGGTSAVRGVDGDLRIKPFFAQGATISIREFIVGAFKGEMGLEAFDPVLCAATDPLQPQARISAAGFVFDPAPDTFERPPVCSARVDNDGDGVSNEIDAALIDHMEFYLLNYFKAGQYRVTARA